jgi:hypothetical protein
VVGSKKVGGMSMTKEQKQHIQKLLDEAKNAVSKLFDNYGWVMNDDDDKHQEAYGFLTIADYALDDFQDKFSKLEE